MKTVKIIAEAGVNHNGDPALARKLVETAAWAGADFVKFQTFKSEQVAAQRAPMAEYQQKNAEASGDQVDMLKQLELSASDFVDLCKLCDQLKIGFMSTAFDHASAVLVDELGVGVHKIPSGEITNVPYLRQMAGFGKPIILSTGMSTLSEIDFALTTLQDVGVSKNEITVLHCTTEYPAPIEDVNLSAIKSIKQQFNIDVGYSDHTDGIDISIAAVAVGASVIEKHFTLDRNLPGPDHRASLEPDELHNLVTSIRRIERAWGDGKKRVMPSEEKNRLVARRSLVAVKPIEQGEAFTAENIGAKRPATGVSPIHFDDIIGSVAKRSYRPDDPIEF